MGGDILGIHHITAIAGDPQRNLEFYTGVLGLRLVKLTVNYDDPETYHLYFGDGEGHPGTILTFFPWPEGARGRIGTGQATVTSFRVPEGSLRYWLQRFSQDEVPFDEPEQRLGEQVLAFRDPDGLRLELVAHAGAETQPFWEGGPVPKAAAIRGFYGVTLSVEGYERTAALLDGTLGFRHTAQLGNRFRYEVGAGGPGGIVDVLCAPDLAPGRVAVGTVHHVAFRVAGDAEHKAWRERIAAAKLNVTPIIDRRYFKSIYFREPGGVLFEVATDPPGFATDESMAELGTRLQLPPWVEPLRSRLERALPALRLPEVRA